MFYYLNNFLTVLDWIAARYSDMLIAEELAFIENFKTLPLPSQALLVRMAMRKGELFRASKLRYDEIGCPRRAAEALVAAGWLDDAPLLGVDHLFALLRKAELAAVFDFPSDLKNARKDVQLAALLEDESLAVEARTLADWHPEAIDDCIYHLRIDALCERLRLMFFGNLHQDWSEFVLSELGIFKYEKVALSAISQDLQGFRNRQDIDDYLHLQRCRERFHAGETIAELMPAIPAAAYTGDWLESRRAKLLFQIAQQHERNDALADALRIYADCPWPGARMRMVRVLERLGQIAVAFAFAQAAAEAPENEAERQQLSRTLPRLRRQLGHAGSSVRTASPVMRHDLTLERPTLPMPVEALVRDHLSRHDAPALYVENTLINSLFGLLCWEAIFAPVSGAFFHPFQSGPADLLSPDFHRRREREFLACLAQLDSDAYRHTILRNFRDKAGTLSPFVYWDLLTEPLLNLALHCLPAAHLRKWFERLLLDIRANRSGYPDLIQFWPEERRYRMIEVKGPGDRLQDNQIRWLDYCAAHDMPVSVCYVQWAQEEAA